MDDFFLRQREADLAERSANIASILSRSLSNVVGIRPVVRPDGTLDPVARNRLQNPAELQLIANELAQANVRIRFGLGSPQAFIPSVDGDFSATFLSQPAVGQAHEQVTTVSRYEIRDSLFTYVVEVTLSDPLTFRAAAVNNITGLLVAVGLFALGMSLIVAAVLARRFTTPLRRLTDAARGLAEGDLSRRVSTEHIETSPAELTELSRQFNAMAEQLEESVSIIRRDRDRSRDFLADVSHELRTPIAALRTFNELLKEQAGSDPAARAEFLESSGQQIDRLDWLAQNLLELSKLDSGLVLLDLRPDDLRASIESSMEQAEATAKRRGIDVRLSLPDAPLRIRHDPLRIGQVVANLVGNAVKFTPPGGSVSVAVRPHPAGAEIEVADTGVGIDAAELPRIFERFYRGSRANEARGSGSGLGLAIVRSIVDMHGGTVTVESSLGRGSRFTVVLPRDPRGAREASEATTTAPDPTPPPTGGETEPAKVADSSPTEGSRLNPGTAP
jgi:signal transduction histidine kinase